MTSLCCYIAKTTLDVRYVIFCRYVQDFCKYFKYVEIFQNFRFPKHAKSFLNIPWLVREVTLPYSQIFYLLFTKCAHP